jgi:hypothetical protein
MGTESIITETAIRVVAFDRSDFLFLMIARCSTAALACKNIEGKDDDICYGQLL